MKLRSIILWPLERIGSEVISRVFWPPAKASVLVEKEGKVLAIDTGDYLMLPGGLVEKGESFEEAARRELKEETGLEAGDMQRIDETTENLPGIEAIFYADATGSLSGSWEGEPRWVDKKSLEKHRWRFNRDIKNLLSRK